MKRQKGFTLVETLVSVGILAILFTIILTIIFMVLRSAEKIGKIKEIKQSGETAVSVMTDFIRQADSIDCSNERALEVEMGGETTVFSCTGPIPQQIASNSAYLTSSEVDCADSLRFSCVIGGGNTSLVSFSFTLSLGGYSSDFSGKVLLLTQ